MLTLVLTRHGLTSRSIRERHLGLRIGVPLNEVVHVTPDGDRPWA